MIKVTQEMMDAGAGIVLGYTRDLAKQWVKEDKFDNACVQVKLLFDAMVQAAPVRLDEVREESPILKKGVSGDMVDVAAKILYQYSGSEIYQLKGYKDIALEMLHAALSIAPEGEPEKVGALQPVVEKRLPKIALIQVLNLGVLVRDDGYRIEYMVVSPTNAPDSDKWNLWAEYKQADDQLIAAHIAQLFTR